MIEILTPAVTHDLTTLTTAKEELGIPLDDTSKDSRLRRLIGDASSMVASYCRREGFGRTQYRETFDRGPSAYWRRNGVILEEDLNVQVESVTVDGVPIDVSGYSFENGILRRRIIGSNSTIFIGSYGWNCHTMVVDYWAGWSLLADVPQVVERATLSVLGSLYNNPASRDRSIRSEEQAGVGTITYATQSGSLLSDELFPGLAQYAKQAV